MASIVPRPNGHTWIFVKCANSKRRAVRLGEIDQEAAAEAHRRLTLLEKSFCKGIEIDGVTMAWFNTLPPILRERVIRTGLVQADPKAPQCNDRSLDNLISQWEKTLDIKASTLRNYRIICDNLRVYFGATRAVSSIVPAEADKFRAWLRENGRKRSDKPMARATVSRRCRAIREIMQFAVRLKWVEVNPFGHVKSEGEFNESRNYYVTQRLVDKLVDLCPDQEFSAMLILCRYASGRGPSEFSGLAWSDIDFGAESLWWTSPKTARYEGGRRRLTPLNETCLKQLSLLWESAETGAQLVFPRLGSLPSSDISQRLQRLCRSVQVALWEKPWVNMRASCETDWQLLGHSIFETAAWMGHSPEMALRHYNRNVKDQIADLPEIEAPRAKRSAQKRSTTRSTMGESRDSESSSGAITVSTNPLKSQ